jgi:hypothetical protein
MDSSGRNITPEVAAVLARWLGLGEEIPAEALSTVFEGVRQGVDRLYAVDVERFEFDFLKPDSHAP